MDMPCSRSNKVDEMQVETSVRDMTTTDTMDPSPVFATSASFDSAYGDSEGCSQSSESSSSSSVIRPKSIPMAPPLGSPIPQQLSCRRGRLYKSSSCFGNGVNYDNTQMSPRRLFGTGTLESKATSPLGFLSTQNPCRKSRTPWVDVSTLVTGKILVDDANLSFSSFLEADDLGTSVGLLSLRSKDCMGIPQNAVRSGLKRTASPEREDVGPVTPVVKRLRGEPTIKSKSCEQIISTDRSSVEADNFPTGDKPDETLFSSIKNSSVYHKLRKGRSVADAVIMTAIHEFGNDPFVVGDCSQKYVLPILKAEESRHQDLKEISPETVIDLINGKYQDTIDSYHIIDCRYPYEFNAGHISTAQNLYTELMLSNFLLKNKRPVLSDAALSRKRTVIVFHCEFSAERGPTMCRRLRAWDRNINISCFPLLHYPELYVLNGGYRRFYLESDISSPYCVPCGYQPMADEAKLVELKLSRDQASAESLGKDFGKKLEKVLRPGRRCLLLNHMQL